MPQDTTKVDLLLAQFPGPVTIRTSGLKFGVLCAPLVVLVAFGVWKVWHWHPLGLKAQAILTGIYALPLALLIVLVTILHVKDMRRITLDSDGIAFHWPFGVQERRWNDVSRFVSRVVYVGFSDTSQPTGFLDKLSRVGSRGRRILINFFALGSNDLARLMTLWRERGVAAKVENWRQPLYGAVCLAGACGARRCSCASTCPHASTRNVHRGLSVGWGGAASTRTPSIRRDRPWLCE